MLLQTQLQDFLLSLLQPFLPLFYPIILIPAIVIVFILVKQNKEYKKSAYYQITKLPYRSVKGDTGRYGEYLTYKYLKSFETSGAKFLFNTYIPKDDGETTEIDVLMICAKGIFVFESKNYSGWIFGSEDQKNWYQTLPSGKGRSHKEKFYNPIMQNRSHIKHLKAFLGEQIPMHSIVVFSDRCTLKNIQIKSNNISVINRYKVAPVISAICNQISKDLLDCNSINDLYDKLYPYTQVDAIAKAEHVAHIQNNLKPSAATQLSTTTNPLTSTEPTILQTQAEDHLITTKDIVETPKVDEKNISGEKQNFMFVAPDDTCKCPQCGSNLVLRTATRGKNVGKQFYGCINYPKCKHIRTIAEETV